MSPTSSHHYPLQVSQAVEIAMAAFRGLQWVKILPVNPGVHITKNPNFDPISTFSYFHYKS